VFAAGRAFVAARLRASQAAGVLGAVDVDEAAELLVRLAFSFVLIQESVLPLEDEAHARDVARRLIAPVLGAAYPTAALGLTRCCAGNEPNGQ
jgi:hypothetical protein